ncbi:hypothetical protein [Streptomyces sp. NPDC048436]|uniref:hypothetical protein n=1 Tax=Streptomyces sp. NPDC048436 TaxID=3365550 RepID=UPI003715B4CE
MTRNSPPSSTYAGHLRWIKEHLTAEDNSMRWVTRTYWSRKPRSEQEWLVFVEALHGIDVTPEYQAGLVHVTEPEPEPAAPEPGPAPAPPQDSPAYRALAGLRAADPRMALARPRPAAGYVEAQGVRGLRHP